MATYYSQDKENYEKLQNRVKRYKSHLPQPKTVTVPMFINIGSNVGKGSLSPSTTSTTPYTDLRLVASF